MIKTKPLVHSVGEICPICEKKIVKFSTVVVFDKDTITHLSKCSIDLLNRKQQYLPEKERMSIRHWDIDFCFTNKYEDSSKAITNEEFQKYKERWFKILLPTAEKIAKTKFREHIWEGMSKRYIHELRDIHTFSRHWDRIKDTCRSNFKKTFMPSVIQQFKAKGYLSKRQWELVREILTQSLNGEEKEQACGPHISGVRGTFESLDLPDRLRFMQRKKSFERWFNQKNGLIENEEIDESPK